jgi:hypothetical protein
MTIEQLGPGLHPSRGAKFEAGPDNGIGWLRSQCHKCTVFSW